MWKRYCASKGIYVLLFRVLLYIPSSIGTGIQYASNDAFLGSTFII